MVSINIIMLDFNVELGFYSRLYTTCTRFSLTHFFSTYPALRVLRGCSLLQVASSEGGHILNKLPVNHRTDTETNKHRSALWQILESPVVPTCMSFFTVADSQSTQKELENSTQTS